MTTVTTKDGAQEGIPIEVFDGLRGSLAEVMVWQKKVPPTAWNWIRSTK